MLTGVPRASRENMLECLSTPRWLQLFSVFGIQSDDPRIFELPDRRIQIVFRIENRIMNSTEKNFEPLASHPFFW
jgi:hypothetical protein